jgi:hypothetical protein
MGQANQIGVLIRKDKSADLHSNAVSHCSQAVICNLEIFDKEGCRRYNAFGRRKAFRKNRGRPQLEKKKRGITEKLQTRIKKVKGY